MVRKLTSRDIHNSDVADAFDEIGDLLSIQGANTFRIRAYRYGAQLIRSLQRELAEMEGPAEYDALPGIGKDLAGKIAELVGTGQLRSLQELRRKVPAGARELLKLPGMGPVRVHALMTKLRIRSGEDLERALAAGRLEGLRGFGPVLRKRLHEALASAAAAGPVRMPIASAAPYAESLRRQLAAVPGILHAEVAGSYRRGRDTVGDLDLLACAGAGVEPFTALERYPDLREMKAEGTTRAAGVLRNGLAFDVRVVPPESYGSALQYFTGSKYHVIHVRRLAQQGGMKLSEYGLFRGHRRIVGEREEDVYHALGMDYIPPELREDRGEIEAAQAHALPVLVERADLAGDLHVHTDASDGTASIGDMVAAARLQHLSYIAITDHAKYLGMVHGLDAARLSRQAEAIDRLNERLDGFTVLKGTEVDILEDGRLALPDAVLARLDVVVIAVHSHFDLPQERQTLRVLRALERPHVSILAHPGGRLLGERAPIALDFEGVLDAVRERGCFVEVNAQPTRLDLDEFHVRAAIERGVRLSIASDAHSVGQLAFLEGGVRQARRGWARRQDVLNTLPVDALRRLLCAIRS
jgi:DNA polymerase (family 10)